MTSPAELLRSSHKILLIDWPSREVPDSLVRAGHEVVSRDSAEGDDWTLYELVDGDIQLRSVDRAPEHVDLVYCHRPTDELPRIIAQAGRLGARTIWLQSGLADNGERDRRGTWLPRAKAQRAREIVVAAGFEYVDSPYIGFVAAAESASS